MSEPNIQQIKIPLSEKDGKMIRQLREAIPR